MTEADLQPPFVPDGARRLVDVAVRHKRYLVGGWAVVIAAASIAHFASQTPQGLLPIRSEAISGSIAVLDHGGPPLLTSRVPYRAGLPAHQLAPIEGHDTGIALYLPLLGHAVGEPHPAVLMKWLFAAAFGLLVLTVPLVAYELFGSLLFALIAPILVLWRFEGTQTMDIYWVESWCLLLCLPPLVLAARWWRAGRRRPAALLLGALALCAGFASAIRTDSGLAVIVGAGALVLLADVVAERRRPRLRALGLVALLVLVYLLPSVIAPAAAAAYRDGIVHAVSPLAGAPSHRPETDVALGGLLGDALRTFWLAPILLALGLVLPRRRRDAAVTGALCAVALVVGATLLRVVPDPRYALGWTGAWGVLWLLAIGWTVAELAGLRARGWKHVRRVPFGPAAGVAAVALLVLAALATGSPAASTSTESFYSASETPYVPNPANVAPVAGWSFDGQLPRGWHPARASSTEQDVSPAGEAGLFVKTPPTAHGIALVGPWRRVPAGSYVIAATGDILGGGLTLIAGAQDGTVLAFDRYWWNEENRLGGPMLNVFTVDAPTRVRITFANWAPGASSSRFVLRRVALKRLVPPGVYYAAHASPLVPSPSLRGTSTDVWTFDGGTPQGVGGAVTGAQSSSLPGAFGLVTTTQPGQRQLFAGPVPLSPGRYRVVLQGRVEQGGLELEAVDARSGEVLATRHFWSGQDFASGEMTVPLTLSAGAPVRVVLANWAPQPAASKWVLERLAVERLR